MLDGNIISTDIAMEFIKANPENTTYELQIVTTFVELDQKPAEGIYEGGILHGTTIIQDFFVLVEVPASEAQSGGGCPNCLDPSSVGHNLLGLSYPGGNNPLTRSGDYSYSYVPTNLSEYPAIGHDRRYDKLGIKGASGLFTDTRAIGADWRFVGEELSIAGNPFLNPIDRMSAGILGVGLGLSALPKTLLQLSTPFGYMQTMIWYNISNQGVNNAPTIHKH